MQSASSWSEIGLRVREARQSAGLTQKQLADLAHFERTQLGKVEAGTRQVSAVELFALADALGVPPRHLMSTPTPAVSSRRRTLDDDSDAATRQRFRLDAQLEVWAHDVQWLITERYLVPPAPLLASVPSVTSPDEARTFSRTVRKLLGVGLQPLGDMSDVCEAAGLYVAVHPGDGGASLLLDVDRLQGVALVGADGAPGRRRSTAAHELGHHLLRDEYQTDSGIAASRDQREELIDAFAAELLLPTEVVQTVVQRHEKGQLRPTLIRLAADYRVSWTVVTRVLTALGRDDLSARLTRQPPLFGDFLETVGSVPAQDLLPDSTGRQYRKAVLAAWRDDAVTSSRAVELLRGAMTTDDLPDRDDE